MSNLKLKPCPFCGKEYAFVDYIFHEESYQHYARVMCPVCRAEIGSTRFSDTREEAEEKAIKAWNRRVDDG